MDLQQLVALALGVAVTWVVAVIKKEKWANAEKVALAFGFSLAAAALQLWASGKLNASHNGLKGYVADAALIFAASSAYFKAHFQGTSLEAWLKNLTTRVFNPHSSKSPSLQVGSLVGKLRKK